MILDVNGLLIALLVIAIVCVVFKVVLELAKPAEPLPMILWAVCVIVCLVILIGALTGHGLRLA